MNNALKMARLHLVNAPMTIAMPWAILGSAYAINLVIFALISDGQPNEHVTGALASIFVFGLVANLQSMTQMFPFAAGLSLTRRAFLAGTTLFVLGQALLNAILLTVLLAIEKATDGWGVDMVFFGPSFLVQSNPLTQVLAYLVPFLATGALGLAIGAVFKRWGQSGMTVLSVLSVLGIGGLVVLTTWRDWWGAVGRFFTDTSTLALTAGYPLLLTAALLGAAWLVLRRATP